MSKSIIDSLDDILSDGWDEWITFDRKEAEQKGIVYLCWKKTNIPLPIPYTISQKDLDADRLHIGTLRRNLKKYVPEYRVNELISEGNSLLRNANRRAMKVVMKDYDRWLDETGEELRKMYGVAVQNNFLKEIVLPENIKSGSVQALQYLIEAKVSELLNL